MSTSGNPQNTPSAETNRGSSARGGRGGGRRGKGRGGSSAKEVTKVTPAKIGPSRVLDTNWTEEQGLKGPSFCVWLGGAQGLPQQWTYHHPVGETELGEGSWVATPTSEIPLLLSRKKSEALLAWERQKDKAAREQLLHSGTGRLVVVRAEASIEVWAFDGSPDCGPTIKTCMAAARAAGKPESEWVNHADPPVRAAELTFREALKKATPDAAWFGSNPKPAHETRGGPLGDRPQSEVWFLQGSTLAQAKDRVLGVVTGNALRPRRATPPSGERPAPPEEQSSEKAPAE